MKRYSSVEKAVFQMIYPRNTRVERTYSKNIAVLPRHRELAEQLRKLLK